MLDLVINVVYIYLIGYICIAYFTYIKSTSTYMLNISKKTLKFVCSLMMFYIVILIIVVKTSTTMFINSIDFLLQLDRTPVHWAASKGHIEILSLLIQAKCDLEVVDKVGRST